MRERSLPAQARIVQTFHLRLPQNRPSLLGVEQPEPSCRPRTERLVVGAELVHQQWESLLRPGHPDKFQEPALESVVRFSPSPGPRALVQSTAQVVDVLDLNAAHPLVSIERQARFAAGTDRVRSLRGEGRGRGGVGA
jgi:hypothetical protein